MPLRIGILFCLLFLSAAPPAAAQTAVDGGDETWWRRSASGDPQITLYVFWSETCPHCVRAQPFVDRLAAERPWLTVSRHEVSRSEANIELLFRLSERIGVEIKGVPAFVACGQAIIGYDSPEGVGVEIAALVDRCRQVLLAQGEATAPNGETAGSDAIRVPMIGPVRAEALSLPLLTLIMAGMDAFNPCAFFVLLFLLSLLVHVPSRGRMLLVGGLFVTVSGAAYFAFMAAWLNLFLVVEGIGWITLVAGAIAIVIGAINIKDFVWFKAGVSLTLSERAKGGLFARMRGLLSAERLPALLLGTASLAVAANLYELLCTSGFPLVYTRILTLHDLPAAGYYLYLVFYNLIYVLPLFVIVMLFAATLGARKLTERQGRALKLLSGVMMLGLGLVLLAAPGLLSVIWTGPVLLVAAVVITAAALWATRWMRRPAP